MSGVIRDDGQVAPTLADDLLAGGDRDEVGEPFEGERVAVVDQLGDRIRQRRDRRHRRALIRVFDVDGVFGARHAPRQTLR